MKVMVIDDHSLFAKGMSYLLNKLDDKVEVLTANSHAATLEILSSGVSCDLVLLDLYMPNTNGIEVLCYLVEKMPFCPIVVISASLSPNDVKNSLDNGAMGFIPKTAEPEAMLNALRLVLSGEIYIPPKVNFVYDSSIDTSIEAGKRLPSDREYKKIIDLNLTSRQLDVLKLLVQGKMNKEIAIELGCAEATVKVHVSVLLKTLGASNRTQATQIVNNMGLRM